MADEEAEQERSPAERSTEAIAELKRRLEELRDGAVRAGGASPEQSSSDYCQEFCRTLLEYAGRWRIEEEPLPLMEVYMVALLSYAQASPYLSLQCENVPLVIERLSMSFLELLLSLKDIPDGLWQELKSSVQFAHSKLEENGIAQLSLLSALGQSDGVWTSSILQSILSNENPPTDEVETFLVQEGPVLLEMRVKQLMKEKRLGAAALLAKTCSECPAFQGKASFKQMYLVCLCATSEQEPLMEELSKEDCQDALEMICNLESEGDDGAAFSLCSAFLTRQLLQADTYCAWELTLFWSKLLKRMEPSEQAFIDKCRQMSLLSKTVYHILFLIKVIQSEIDHVGLPVCVEMCIRALRVDSDDGNMKATLCKTISCLLPNDLEVKRACQLTEFLLEPTVDSYYAVETLYNEPDQKLEEDNLPIPNSLRCDLLLVFKTQWPFDPEFWDWKTLKRHCLALMGEEASIVSSIDLLNDNESPEEEDDVSNPKELSNIPSHLVEGTYDLNDITDRKQKNREMKKLREKGFISARFRNWQAYMQYCVLCDKEFLGHRIVRHAQTHLSGGIYTCPICTQTFTSKDTLIPHVTSHVKESCKERLTAMKTNKNLSNPTTSALVLAALKAEPQNKSNEKAAASGPDKVVASIVQTKVAKISTTGSNENVCPVGRCKRIFKFFKNLIAHVKTHGDDEEARTFLEMKSKKVVCQYCRRHFISVTHLNDHLQVHCGVKPYICIQLNCKASFMFNTELLIHRKTHTVFRARCMFPNCGKIFSEAFKLYDHEAQHYKTFTCKRADCGKVFHSQQQLDLHQQKHAAEEEEKPPSEQTSQNQKPGTSLIKQMLCNPAPLKQENCAENPDPTFVESLLKSPQTPAETAVQYRIKEPGNIYSTSQAQTLNTVANSVIQSVHSHFPEANRHQADSGAPSFGYMGQPQANQPVPPIEPNHGNVLQSQPPMFQNNVNTQPFGYNPNCNLPMPVQQGPVYPSNLLAVSQPQNSTKSAVSQPLPPTVNPQQMTGYRPENPVIPTNSKGPPPGHRERYHCAFENCTRHYSSYKSMAKHMKAIHTEFYERWKANRTKIKITYVLAQPKPPVGHLNPASLPQNQQADCALVHAAPRQNVIQSPPYTNVVPSANYNALHSLPPSVSNLNGSCLMTNALNPVVVSQLGNNRTQEAVSQSQVSGSQNWQPTPGSDQIYNCGPSQEYQSNLQVMPQATLASATLPLSVPSCTMIASGVNRITGASMQAPLMDNKAQAVLPSNINGVKEVLQQAENLPQYKSQSHSTLPPGSKAPEATKTMQNHLQGSFPSPGTANQKNTNTQYQNTPVVPENNIEKPQKRNRKRRTKWPAIIKDGKFVCCRCFRQFDSPKSLGGHLSKRAVCKPYQEEELNTDLPRSFLDFLHSEQTVGTSQPQLPFNAAAAAAAAAFQKTPQSVTNASTSGKDYSAPNYSQDNLSGYGNSEANDDILQQIMAESNTSDLYMPPPSAQTLYSNRCGSYGAALPGGSVIQHTENVQLKQEGNPYSAPHYAQPSIDAFSGNGFPDPILSQFLTESPATAVPGSTPINQVPPGEVTSEGYQAITAIQTAHTDPSMEVQTLLPHNQLSSPPSGNQTEVERKATEQDVKKRLREQILAGDLQRRNNNFHSGSNDPNAGSMSFGNTCSLSNNSGLHRSAQASKSDLAAIGKHFQENSAAIPGTSGEIGLLNTQSFTNFRETAAPHQDVLSPTGTVANEPDLEPPQLSASQQQYIKDIQCAFERLDLVRERSELAALKQASGPAICPVGPEKIKARKSVSATVVKPFICDSKDCTFSSVSGETLWKHLSKIHNYTLPMVNDVKRRYGLYAPFKCQNCDKAFTRNSNLRTHYQSYHKLSAIEIADLDLKRKMAKAAEMAALVKRTSDTSQAPTTTCTNSSAEANTYPTLLANAVKSEYLQQGISPYPPANLTNHEFKDDSRSTVIHPLPTVPVHTQSMPAAAEAHASTTTFQSVKADVATEQWSYDQQNNLPKIQVSQQVGGHLPSVSVLLNQGPSTLQQAKQPPSIDNYPDFRSQAIVRPSVDVSKKVKEKRPHSGATMSPYRPYRCVHQGCVAAFTIQHNLILHYRSVHQSALSALGVNGEQDQSDEEAEMMKTEEVEEPEVDYPQINEFLCQVKDCCCVFQNVPKLFQHYLQLHEFNLDKISNLLSGIKLGKFTCGHKGCADSFTAFWKYILHVKEAHKDIKLTKPEQGSVTFKCEIDGCELSYATKSNLLRHITKKHQDLYQGKMINPQIQEDGSKQNSKTLHFPIPKTSNGKENIESNKKVPFKMSETKKVSKPKNNHWAKYGKPSLKTKPEAAALCTKMFPLQYPCMIKGCDSVMKSERNILKHYVGHGLSEKYLEQQRSHFIFCKKVPRQKCCPIRSDDSKSDNTSDLSDNDMMPEPVLDGGEFSESSKPVLRRRSTVRMPIVLINKLSSEESSGSSVVIKRKRGRPRKYIENIVKRKKIPHTPKVDTVCSREVQPDSSCPAVLQEEKTDQTAPLATFKPMGFEVSFLKFLEQSNKSEPALVGKDFVADKWRSRSSPNTCVLFRNRQKLKSLGKIQINLDGAFSGVSDLMLKQLQDMQPAVVLTKYE